MYRNLQSTLAPLKDYVKLPSYFGSEWSYAQYRIPAQRSHIALSAAAAAQAAASSIPSGEYAGNTARLADVAADERCVVAWIPAPPPAPPDEYQLVALTYSGGWYRIGLPSSSEATAASGSGAAGTAAGSSASTVAGGGAGGPASPRKQPRPLTPSLVPTSYIARTNPRPRSASGSTAAGTSARPRLTDREERERGSEKSSRACVLLEFRRFGRWDGWG